MFGEGNKSGIEGWADKLARSVDMDNKAEVEITLAGKELPSEALSNVEAPKNKPENLEDLKARIEIALAVNPKSKKEQAIFYENSATILAIESFQKNERKM